MSNYPVHSKSIWGYLVDMPYMPSRSDREKLLVSDDPGRVQIWDYFFRIKPDDVGKSLKEEIKEIDVNIKDEIFDYSQKKIKIENSISHYKMQLLWKRIKSLFYSAICFAVAALITRFFEKNNSDINLMGGCITPLLGLGAIMLGAVGVVGIKEKAEIRDLKNQSLLLHENHNNNVKDQIERKKFLKSEIKELIKQIPVPPTGIEVRQWLVEHLNVLIEESKRATGLGNRLINIASQNPIPVFGPGELQNPERFPPTFKDIDTADDVSSDIKKHLTARRACEFPDGRIDVLYGIYYLEYILIADDMLATYGLFYDFITGKSHAIETTEQYYDDVVSIVVANEFRWIEKSGSAGRALYVEDAPTFTLSLASGEHRTVTFVNEKYFMEIKDKIDVAEENISRIYLIQDSKIYADNAIKALRHQLRLHKSLEENGE